MLFDSGAADYGDRKMVNQKRALYHKCTVVGLVNLFEEFTPSLICASSEENSTRLFWRDTCLVLNVPEKNIVAEHDFDLDSRGQSEYDEVRIKFDTKKELLDAMKVIILDGKQIRTIKAGKHKSPDYVKGKLPTKFFDGRDHQKADSLAIKYFFEKITDKCEILNFTEAKKRNKIWNRTFLNM